MNKDFDLRKSIDRSEKDLIVANIEIEQLKKEKLKIKDKILAKQNELKHPTLYLFSISKLRD